MRTHVSAAFAALVAVMGAGLEGSSALAQAGTQAAPMPIQYGPYPDPRGNDYYSREPVDPRDRYTPPYGAPRDAYDRTQPLWRPGDRLPLELLDYVVEDWDPRGLGRPPGGHLWVRVGYQFILVRERDQMIARTINFD